MSDVVIVALVGALGGIVVAALNKACDAWAAHRNRKNGKEDDMQLIKKKLDKQERDSCRTQMLLLMSDYPDQTDEIMRLAQHYFRDLHGNWYMTTMFNRWLESNGIGKPEWFDM